MAKISGLAAFISVEDAATAIQTISNDVTNFAFTTPRAVQDITGVDKLAHETLLLLADATVQLNGVFNSASTFSHSVFSTVASTTVPRTTKIAPTASSGSSPYISMVINYTDYSVTRAAAGELTWQAPGVLADGTPPVWS